MSEGTHEFKVSAEQSEYLKQLVSNDESLAGLLKFEEGAHSRKATIRLDRAGAKRLRKYLTVQLAKFGFDENYSPNEQGRMLEDLIDLFFLS